MLAALLVLSTTPAAIVQAGAKPILASRGFQFLYDHSSPGDGSVHLAYRRASDTMLIFIDCSRATSAKPLDDLKETMTHPAEGTVTERSPSGVSLGDFSYQLQDDKLVVAAADGFTVRVSLPYGDPLKEPEKDTRAIEAVARVSLADLIGSTLDSKYRPTTKQNLSIEHTHATYVSAQVLAKLNQASFSVNDSGDRAIVKSNGHLYEFALASNSMLVDGKRDTLEAFVARKDGIWLIPGDTLRVFGFRTQ